MTFSHKEKSIYLTDIIYIQNVFDSKIKTTTNDLQQ